MTITESKFDCYVVFTTDADLAAGRVSPQYPAIMHLFDHRYDESSTFHYGILSIACENGNLGNWLGQAPSISVCVQVRLKDGKMGLFRHLSSRYRSDPQEPYVRMSVFGWTPFSTPVDITNTHGIAIADRPGLNLLNSGPSSMIYHGGRLLTRVRVKPIFWGPQWLTLGHPPVPPAAIIWAIRTIFFSPYVSSLSQYSGIQNGIVEPIALAAFDAGPPNPFTRMDIERMLKGLLDDRIIPDPATNDQLLACVFTPPGVKSNEGNANGYHTAMSYRATSLPYAWMSNDGTLEFISSIFSHELAEACTDPTFRGYFDDSLSFEQSEISDFCYGLGPGRGSESHGGVLVQSYWSAADDRCIVPQERFVLGATSGVPSLIQGRFLAPGNFELVAPLQSGGIAHYSRVNNAPTLPWAGPAVFATELGQIDAVSMIQSNFTSGGNVGNLEVVALAQGALLIYSREDLPPYRWHGPTVIPLRGVNVRGNPVLIQGRFLVRGNFELVVPLTTAGMAHYSRVNDDPTTPWYGPAIFGVELGLVDSVAMIQSTYSSGGYAGNLEVVARCGGTLFFYWREDVPPYRWHGPTVIPSAGLNQGFHLAAGCPSLLQNRHENVGNFELVTPLADGGLAHYTRANGLPGAPWSGPAIFGANGGRVDGVSLIQSTFKLAPYGVGNLELIAQLRGQLFHFWFDNPVNPVVEGFPWDWFGPWVVTE